MTGDLRGWLPLATPPPRTYSAGPACLGLHYSLSASLTSIHDPTETIHPTQPLSRLKLTHSVNHWTPILSAMP